MCLMGVFLLIAFVFVLNIKIDIPEQIQGYYVSVDGAVLTENGLMIPLDELEKSVVTEQEIHSLFIPYYVAIVTRTTLAAFAISLVLSFVFAHILTSRIIRPIEEGTPDCRESEAPSRYWILFTLPKWSIVDAWLRLEKSTGVLTAEPDWASTTVTRTPSLPGDQKLVEVPWFMFPPPPSMLPCPEAKACAGHRQSTRAAVQRRA